MAQFIELPKENAASEKNYCGEEETRINQQTMDFRRSISIPPDFDRKEKRDEKQSARDMKPKKAGMRDALQEERLADHEEAY